MSRSDGRNTAGAHCRLDAFNKANAQKNLTYYDVLGVSESATQDQIVRVYRRLSLKLHPDKPGGSNEQFQELSRAYKCLKDPETRRKYDDCGFDEDNIDCTEVDTFVDAFFGESARNIDGRSGDWSTNSVTNYNRVDLANIPVHMKDIVRIGLQYIVAVDTEFKDVVLLQHSRIDILYLMVGMWSEGELTQDLFASENSYPITYYDNPLQPGICPRWSDQNVLASKEPPKKKNLPTRQLSGEEYQRRQKIALAMIENGPVDPMAALEEKYRNKMLQTQHQQALTAAELRREAICGQDVYEDDAELDCNAYADTLIHTKSCVSDPAEDNPYADFLSIERCIEGSQASQSACKDIEAAENTARGAPQAETVFMSTPLNTAEAIGMAGDGAAFAAKDGDVLCNKGFPRPAHGHLAPSEDAECLKRVSLGSWINSSCCPLGCLSQR